LTEPSRRQVDTSHAIPIIEVWGQLLVPLQGDIGDRQMADLSTRLLERIRDGGAEGLVIDASGVWMVDSHLCSEIGKLASAARFMGTRAVLCGLGPDVVMTLQVMGFDLQGVQTAMRLDRALELLGLRAVRVRIDEDDDLDDLDEDEDGDFRGDLDRELPGAR
jgi:rsbT antagonist protein RsbS